jgi:hypothetical protein
MGFNRQRMESARKTEAEKEARSRRALDPQILEDALRLVEEWNARRERRMPMLFSPTIGAVIAAKYWFLHVRCPACRTTSSVDLRKIDMHREAALTALIPKLSCRGCRPTDLMAKTTWAARYPGRLPRAGSPYPTAELPDAPQRRQATRFSDLA